MSRTRRTLTAAALAVLALPAAASAATVEEAIASLISAKAQTAGREAKAVLLPLRSGATSHAQAQGIAGLEATGDGSVQVWGTGGALTLTFWTDAGRQTRKTLGCNQSYSKTTCEIR
ncbi:hypothetical protein ACM64Y_04480 [Novispirillum sp. DQ9]|uniref:hypothetical protein n=1 Tax=Novispirillum sp. DQ9 TaxID=3398612 RepID=UPI003C7A88D7